MGNRWHWPFGKNLALCPLALVANQGKDLAANYYRQPRPSQHEFREFGVGARGDFGWCYAANSARGSATLIKVL